MRLPVLAVLGLIAAMGCGALSQDMVVWKLSNEVGDSLELEREQRQWVRGRVDAHLSELRGDELGQVVELMMRSRALVWRGADDASLNQLQRDFDAVFDRAVRRFMPDAAQLLSSLDSEQIARLEQDLLRRIDESFADLDLPVDERRRRAEKRIVDEFDELTGGLREEQRQALAEVVQEMPEERELQRDELQRRVAVLTAALRENRGRESVEELLDELWRMRDEFPGVSNDAAARRAHQRRLLLTIDQSLSQGQRSHAVERLDRRISRLESLL